MTADLESRIAKINPKDFGDKFVDPSRKKKINIRRGTRKYLNVFGRRATRTEEELIKIIKDLRLVEEGENPKEIIGLLCSGGEALKYVGGPWDYFHLKELVNSEGEKAYRIKRWNAFDGSDYM